MSLINDALKKAQRDRHLDTLPPIPGGGGRHGRRGRGMSTQTMVLIGAVGVSLFVVAVVGAVLLINREPPAAPKPVAAKVAPKPASDPVASSPMIVLPVPANPTPAAVVAAPTPTPPPPLITLPTVPVPAGEAPAPAPISLAPTRPPSSGTDKFDERLQTLVDGWKVTAVRFSGNESKLFMNGSVYRVDDVIDRASRLRLTKVTTTALTFTDAEGVDYVKRY